MLSYNERGWVAGNSAGTFLLSAAQRRVCSAPTQTRPPTASGALAKGGGGE